MISFESCTGTVAVDDLCDVSHALVLFMPITLGLDRCFLREACEHTTLDLQSAQVKPGLMYNQRSVARVQNIT